MSLSRISEVNIDLWNKQKVQFPAHPDVNIIMGVNGSGKTTFLKSSTSHWWRIIMDKVKTLFIYLPLIILPCEISGRQLRH